MFSGGVERDCDMKQVKKKNPLLIRRKSEDIYDEKFYNKYLYILRINISFEYT